jgi:NADH-quinone oxidoreductase subunit D
MTDTGQKDAIREPPLPVAGREAVAHKTVQIDSHAINFGPQHPAAHGV